MNTDPITPGSEELAGPLGDAVGQIRETPIPIQLGNSAMQRAAAMAGSAWTGRRIAAVSGVAAAICASAFLAGAAMIHWSQPREEHLLAAGGPGSAAEVSPKLEIAQAEGRGTLPLTETANEVDVVVGTNVRVMRDGPVQRPGDVRLVRAASDLPADVQAMMKLSEARVALLDAQLAQLNAQRNAQRAELIANLNTMRNSYQANGQTAEATAVQQQIRLLNEAAPAVSDVQLAQLAFTNGPVPGRMITEAPAPARTDTMTAYRQRVGQTVLVPVVGSANAGSIWGANGVYTDDSPLGVAAVHAGILKDGEPATLKVTILPGQQSYDGNTQNGVTSATYGPWDGSYRIEAKVNAPPNVLITDRPSALQGGTVKLNVINGTTVMTMDGTKAATETERPVVITGNRVLTVEGGKPVETGAYVPAQPAPVRRFTAETAEQTQAVPAGMIPEVKPQTATMPTPR